MKGLIVKSKIAGQEEFIQKVALSDGYVSSMVEITRYAGAHWNVGGAKMPEGIIHTWNYGDLSVGDEIDIEVADIDEADPYIYKDRLTFQERICLMENSKEEKDESVWQRKLERYYRLKVILEKEKLINEGENSSEKENLNRFLESV